MKFIDNAHKRIVVHWMSPSVMMFGSGMRKHLRLQHSDIYGYFDLPSKSSLQILISHQLLEVPSEVCCTSQLSTFPSKVHEKP